jgi:translation initiation factor IF-1
VLPNRRKKTDKASYCLPEETPGETVFAKVARCLGDRRFNVEKVSSGSLMVCRLAGSFPKSHDFRIQPGDTVLVDVRSYESISTVQEQGGTIIHKCTPVEVKTLTKLGKLTERASSEHESSVCFVSTVNPDDVFTGGYVWDLPSSSDSEDDE